MRKTLFCIAVLVSCTILGQAQNSNNLDFSGGIGFQGSSPKELSLAEYREAFPQSELLKQDYSGYYDQPYYYNYSGGLLLNFLWGVKIGEGANNEQRLRIGISYSGATTYSNNFEKTVTTPYDTLISTVTGNQTFVDSVYQDYLNINLSQDQIGLDVSYIIKSNPNNRLVFYSGGGAVLGLAVNSRANIYQNSNSYFSNDNGDYYPYAERYSDNGKSEVHNLASTFWAQLYVPIGLDFRLSKKNAFWQRMHIYSELRPNMQLAMVEGFDPTINLSFGWAVFGTRFEF